MNRRHRSFWLVFALGCFFLSVSAQTLPFPERKKIVNPAEEGRAIINELLAQAPAENSAFYGVFKIRNRDGDLLPEIPVQMRITTNAAGWKEIYATQPTASHPAEQLTVVHTLQKPNEYWFAQKGTGHESEPPKRLQPQQLFQPLAGTDFWIADLGLEFLHWPDQSLVEKTYNRTRWCYVVDSKNPAPAAGAYSRVRSWIDWESGGFINAEAFQGQHKVKVFAASGFKKLQGRWQVEKLEIRDLARHTKTTLVFDFESRSAADAPDKNGK